MKIAAVALLALVACATATFVEDLTPLDLSQPANNLELISEINNKFSNGQSTWWAKANWDEDMTLGDVQAMLGGEIDPEDIEFEYEFDEYTAPDSWLWPEESPECTHPIRDQGRCGSCWAFAEVETLSARFCIQSEGAMKPILSAQDPVSCDRANMGCRGGRLSSWKYMAKNGVVLDSCMPYTSGQGDRGKCPKECTAAGEEWVKYKSQKAGACRGEKKLMECLSQDGPVEVAFSVYEDFITYGGGVYKHTTGKVLGGHAVMAVGYSTTEDGTPYWLVANSWSEKWGEDGYFRFIRGINDCGLESQTVAGKAAI